MIDTRVDDLNVLSEQTLISPDELKAQRPLSDAALRTVAEGRATIRNILERTDPRLFLVVGPCSIHDPGAALEYAEKLKVLADQVSDTLFIVMRVYFEKPRTTVGWKGFINDPHMNGSFNIQDGLAEGRKLLMQLADY